MDFNTIFHPTDLVNLEKISCQPESPIQDAILSPPITPKVRAQFPSPPWSFGSAAEPGKLISSTLDPSKAMNSSRRKSSAYLYRRKHRTPSVGGSSDCDQDITFIFPPLVSPLMACQSKDYRPLNSSQSSQISQISVPQQEQTIIQNDSIEKDELMSVKRRSCPIVRRSPSITREGSFGMDMSDMCRPNSYRRSSDISHDHYNHNLQNTQHNQHSQHSNFLPQRTPYSKQKKCAIKPQEPPLPLQVEEHVITSTPIVAKPVKTSCSVKPERYIKKKAKTDAAVAYDQVDIHLEDTSAYEPEWIPSLDVFDRTAHVRVVWKGSPVSLVGLAHYELLHPGEVHIASTLRLTPEQYLKCKRVLVLGAQEASKEHVPFRKSDAQRVCRIDVNKASTLWSVFGRLGWLGGKWPN